jgi:S-DNA-T family DNA segregation ATPase FtsK/SpoIIIE
LQKEVENKIVKLEKKLERFSIYGRVTNRYIGPLVTVFEYEPNVDTKLSKIVMLEDDLAMVLQAISVRILAPIPGKSVVGFEVANTQRQSVWFKELFTSSVYQKTTKNLPLILGTDTAGKEIVADLAAMPHLLIAGSTGSGKSVALNSMLISLLSKKSFNDMKLILIDPKRLEFMSYAHIPHLLFPIVTHSKKAVNVLKWLVQEMDRRYEEMAKIGVRDCQEYNKKQKSDQEKFPFIVVVIDEFADLMITVKKDIEDLITRIAQMARAAGIHMIIATQRPSVDVITGLIKVNFTSRIALRVASKIDSRTILDTNGAERLLAKGDMLFLDGTIGQLKRVHGPFISSQEIERAVQHVCKQGTPMYHDLDMILEDTVHLDNQEDTHLYQQILAFIQHTDKISISLLQRQFKIGYNRSARLIETLERNGLIMPADGAKLRRVIR